MTVAMFPQQVGRPGVAPQVGAGDDPLVQLDTTLTVIDMLRQRYSPEDVQKVLGERTDLRRLEHFDLEVLTHARHARSMLDTI